jgi:DnaB-like helicase C terminal domain
VSVNIELALVTKVIDDQSFAVLEKNKIDETFFFSPEALEAYRFIRDTYHATTTAGCIPSRELLRSYFPAFTFFDSNDTTAVLVEQLRRSKISVEVQLHAQDLLAKVESDPLAALSAVGTGARILSALAGGGEDISMASAARVLEQRYNLVAEGKGIIGIPYPWQPLNECTQGLNPQNFVAIYGRPKSMKTWVACKIATHAYLHARRRVLFYSREMAPEEVMERIACIIARVNYNEFINGRLQPEPRDRLFTILRELADDERMMGAAGAHQPFFQIISDREATDGGGVSWLQAKIDEYEPDIAFVDGMYLMKDDRTKSRAIDWKNITHISQDMKGAARSAGIPIVGITQANRGAEKTTGEDLTELSFADAIGQDADAIFRVKKFMRIDEQLKQKVTELLITAPGLRKGIFEGMILRADPGHTFDLIKVLTGLDPKERENYHEAKDHMSGGPPDGGPRLQKRNPFLRSGVLRDPKIPQMR